MTPGFTHSIGLFTARLTGNLSRICAILHKKAGGLRVGPEAVRKRFYLPPKPPCMHVGGLCVHACGSFA